MLKPIAIAALLTVPALAQTRTPVIPLEHLDEIRTIKCQVQLPDNFGCAILFEVGFPSSGNMIVSMVGGFVDQISLILDSTLYTVAYDPPLERDDKFRRRARVPARVDGDDLIIQWPDGTQARGKIVRREKINPNRPQHA
jgi:hypothetical protein